MLRSNSKNFIISVLCGGLSGIVATYAMVTMWGDKSSVRSQNDFIAEYYEVENAVLVSPHSLRKSMDKGDTSFILVDLRSSQEYEKEHIIGAVNIPAYKDPNTSAYDEVDRIVSEFQKLPKDKDIIVYCYSIPCMTGRKIGKMLTEHNIYVKHLGIGWNEWRYFWNLWNHELEWSTTRAEDYVAQGFKPGTPKVKQSSTSCPIEGGFGC